MSFVGRAYRAHDPRWSFSPTSGRGAELTGGRFNVKGTPALYLALDPVTALLEVTQGFADRLNPVVLCEYDLDCTPIANLCAETDRKTLGVTLEQMQCGWLMRQLAGSIAPSQACAQHLAARGYRGALVPSFVPGASSHNRNIVLWDWGPALPSRVVVHDPSGRLPKDQTSWD